MTGSRHRQFTRPPLEHGSLTGTVPRVIVVLIGVNDFGNGHNPDETARGIVVVVRLLRDKVASAL